MLLFSHSHGNIPLAPVDGCSKQHWDVQRGFMSHVYPQYSNEKMQTEMKRTEGLIYIIRMIGINLALLTN
jgi:hypothetical protein